VMVTGDNAHCGYYIAKACMMVEPGVTIYLTNDKIEGDQVTWSDMDNGAKGINLSTSEVSRRAEAKDVELAVKGKAMTVLTETGLLDDLLLKVRIFARVQPDQKVQVVTMYIDKGFITGM
jgi:magnesium-transporting ATPase (P-type)